MQRDCNLVPLMQFQDVSGDFSLRFKRPSNLFVLEPLTSLDAPIMCFSLFISPHVTTGKGSKGF